MDWDLFLLLFLLFVIILNDQLGKRKMKFKLQHKDLQAVCRSKFSAISLLTKLSELV